MRNLSVTPLLALDRDFGRMLDRFFADAPVRRSAASAAREGEIRIDVSETDDAFFVHAEIPGVDPEELELHVQGDLLTLAGEKRPRDEETEGRTTYTERAYGSFRREIPLSSEVNPEGAEAEHKHGVVTIRLPKAASVRPRRIEVKAQ